MFEYMKNPDLKLLAQLIVKEKNKFTQLSGKGYELDTVFSLLNNLSETLAFLNIENELSYSPKETPIRSLIYLYTMAYNLGTFYKSKKYSSLPGSYSVWVFPNVKHYHNRLEDHKFNETVIIDDMESAFVDTTEHKGTVDKLNAYFFFLGNPEDINFSKNLDEKEIKRCIIMYLFDSLYNMNISTKKN